MAKPPAALPPQTPRPSRGKKLLIAVVVLLLITLIAVAGFIALLLLKKDANNAGDAPATAPAASTVVVNLDAPPTFVALEPFVVNLRSGEGDRFLRAVISLRVVDERIADGVRNFMPEIRHRINLLLAAKLPSEAGATEGRQALASEIVDEVNQVLGLPPGASTEHTPVRAVLFDQYIIQ